MRKNGDLTLLNRLLEPYKLPKILLVSSLIREREKSWGLNVSVTYYLNVSVTYYLNDSVTYYLNVSVTYYLNVSVTYYLNE